jgi:hypothetical protein
MWLWNLGNILYFQDVKWRNMEVFTRKIAGRGYLPFRLTEPPGWLSGEAIYH